MHLRNRLKKFKRSLNFFFFFDELKGVLSTLANNPVYTIKFCCQHDPLLRVKEKNDLNRSICIKEDTWIIMSNVKYTIIS